ncbi:lipopolysaccharide biosynthesis protein [Luteolibacter pohnpeiensis]|uniref:Lipopolysaccharide biosynthesis protein n=1 Tax=Luteolibacter pohnpeiensis TaxID=454153 RepID=A0A934SCQ4_9BACT|nr:lipopolysaccharide biosynthesis protein [Luteolibacter pohnpeiensis]MBK1882858.1 lipopolysaccharide biosynthesis protein [Luteolibacter pohnpeiensis]
MSSTCDRYFESKKDTQLAKKTAQGGMLVMGSQMSRTGLQFGTTLVLARIIAPADFGLVAMVSIITNFIILFRDMGLTQATIQRETISEKEVSNLFWLNLLLSALLAGLVCAGSPLIALFYGEPRLLKISLALGLSLFVEGSTLQHRALMARNLEFKAIAIAEIIAAIAAASAAIGAAILGWSYWAIVFQTVVSTLVAALVCFWLCPWRPKSYSKKTSIRAYVHYGKNLLAFNLLNYFSRNTDNLLIGWKWGVGPLGLYARAYQLLMLPISQINGPMTKVMLPALSRLQNDPEGYRRSYIKAVRMVAFCSFPVFAFSALMPSEIIRLALGPKWDGAVPLFIALLPAAFIGCLNITTGWVFQSLNTINRQVKWTLIVVPIQVAAMAIGLPFGAIGVAWGVSIAFVLIRIPYLMYTYHEAPVGMKDLGVALIHPTITTLAASTFIYLFKPLIMERLPMIWASASCLAAFGLIICGIDLCLGARSQIRYFLTLIIGKSSPKAQSI